MDITLKEFLRNFNEGCRPDKNGKITIDFETLSLFVCNGSFTIVEGEKNKEYFRLAVGKMPNGCLGVSVVCGKTIALTISHCPLVAVKTYAEMTISEKIAAIRSMQILHNNLSASKEQERKDLENKLQLLKFEAAQIAQILATMQKFIV